MGNLMIRPAVLADLSQIEPVFVFARQEMKENGNPNQWKDNRPSMETVAHDIEKENFYLVLDGTEIVGCFAFILGNDPTYKRIDGKWLDEKPYGTIHRLASNGKRQGIFETVMDFCGLKTDCIRADTHKDNRIMQHLLVKHGFTYCGIILTDDGTPRLAYQWEK